jgi:tetratricopeptide (TPR) repeat protein
MKLSVQFPARAIAETKLNRALILIQLKQYAQAQHDLEWLLLEFDTDQKMQAAILGAMATLFSNTHDIEQAIALERRALIVHNAMPNVLKRAHSHFKLARFLDACATSATKDEAENHRLAAIIYRLCTNIEGEIEISANDYKRKVSKSPPDELPTTITTESVLAKQEFIELKQWLDKFLPTQEMTLPQLSSVVTHWLANITEQ